MDGSPWPYAAPHWAAGYARLVDGVVEANPRRGDAAGRRLEGPATDRESDLPPGRGRFAEGLCDAFAAGPSAHPECPVTVVRHDHDGHAR
ncbi:hypothetical protein [Streptomyces spiralis]|uniref:hypothetical protein n=1 Tax=Streptomyces spiralis TaxID=66376 RepID=UPI0036C1A8D8